MLTARDRLVSALALGRDRLGAMVAVLLGTAIVTATLTLMASATPERPARFAALTAAVQSPAVSTPADPFPETRPWSSAEAETLRTRLAAVPGVTAAIADHTFYAQPVPAGRVAEQQAAHGWASAAMAPHALVSGRPPARDGELVVGRASGVPIGGGLTVLTAAGPSRWSVVGLVEADEMYVSDAVAARMAPGVRVIGLLGEPDVAAVSDIGTVLTADRLGALEPRADARTRWIGLQVLTAMAALASFACVFVIASTFAFSVNQRRRELGLLRAVGATPRQVRRMIAREAFTVGAVASVGGVLLGLPAAFLLAPVLVDAGMEPSSFAVGVHIWPILVGLAAGPLVALCGSVVAVRRAARVSPLEALRLAEVERRPMSRSRWIAGALFAGVAVLCGLLTATTDTVRDLASYSLIAALATVAAAALLAPVVVPPLVSILLWPLRGPIAMVTREGALSGARRVAGTAAPVLLTVAFAVFVTGNVQTTAGAFADRRGDAVQAGAVLAPDGTPGLTDAAVASAGGAALLPTKVYHGSTISAAVGVDPSALGEALPALKKVAAGLATPGTVVLTEGLAAQLGKAPGQTTEFTFADGSAQEQRIVGLMPDGSAPGEVLLPRATVRQHDPSALASAVLLPQRPAGAAAVGSRVVEVAEYARSADREDDRLVWIFTLLLACVSVGYGAIAVANTLAMAAAHRVQDLRRLLLAGATTRQALLTVVAETSLVVSIGTLIGAAAAVLAIWGSAKGLTAQTGRPVTLELPWEAPALGVALCLVLGLAASVIPAARRLRGSPLAETT